MTLEPLGNEEEQPAEAIHIEELHVEPWPDGQRVRVHLALSPFTTRPNLEAAIFDAEENEIQRIHIVENMDTRLVFTMHLRRARLPGKFTLKVQVFLDAEQILDQKTLQFEILQAP